MGRPLRLYLDAGVLLAAWRLGGAARERLARLLEDERFEIVTSRLVEMETVPKAVYHRQHEEARFYQGVLAYATTWVEVDKVLVDRAFDLGCEFGIMGIDALHVAAAERARVDRFVSTEKATKPLYRFRAVNPVRLDDLAFEPE